MLAGSSDASNEGGGEYMRAGGEIEWIWTGGVGTADGDGDGGGSTRGLLVWCWTEDTTEFRAEMVLENFESVEPLLTLKGILFNVKRGLDADSEGDGYEYKALYRHLLADMLAGHRIFTSNTSEGQLRWEEWCRWGFPLGRSSPRNCQ